MLHNLRRVVGWLGFVALIWFWRNEARAVRSDNLYLVGMFLFLLWVPVPVLVGRLFLRKPRSEEQIAWTTLLVHYSIIFVFGWCLIAAFKMARKYPLYAFPFNPLVGRVLVDVSGALVALTVMMLALSGVGAPCAVALSRKLATDWLYRYTRNPMVLSMIVFLLCAGLWMRSTLFLLWTIAGAIPAELIMLRFYEERELELRFGESYLAYKRVTPMLLGRRGKPASARAAAGQ